MAAPITDPLLKRTLEKIEASVPDKYREAYDRIMAAGMQLMFSSKTFPLMEDYLRHIKTPQDIPKLVAHGAVKVISLVQRASKGKMPLEPSGAAAVAIMVHALEYVDRVMKIPITNDILAQTTHLVAQAMTLFLKQASQLSDEDFNKALTPRDPNTPVQSTPAAPPSGLAQGVSA